MELMCFQEGQIQVLTLIHQFRQRSDRCENMPDYQAGACRREPHDQKKRQQRGDGSLPCDIVAQDYPLSHRKAFAGLPCGDEQPPFMVVASYGLEAVRHIWRKFRQQGADGVRPQFSDDNGRLGFDGRRELGHRRIFRNGQLVSFQQGRHLPQFVVHEFRDLMVDRQKGKNAGCRGKHQNTQRQP